MSGELKMVLISDLHYKKHENSEVRPAGTPQGAAGYDPVDAFIQLMQDRSVKADYVICPGDITDRACRLGLRKGWESLNRLKQVVGAAHLLAATGNHEVSSRVSGQVHDLPGNSEAAIDPVGFLQSLPGYPSSIWNGEDRDWVYWGRGYEFIKNENVLFLLINSSHFHITTKPNEFERGRIGDVSLSRLAEDISTKSEDPDVKVCIALLHHPPLSHESMKHDLGRTEMFNGGRLLELLDSSPRNWLVMHGHKHDGRIIMAQGSGNQPIVFAAGSVGADLLGHSAGLNTRLQGYVISLEIPDDGFASLKGRVEAYSWVDNKWIEASLGIHGIPHNSGFASPRIDENQVAVRLCEEIKKSGAEFIKIEEMFDIVPDFRYLMPGQMRNFRRTVERLGGKFTWLESSSFPEDVSMGGAQ